MIRWMGGWMNIFGLMGDCVDGKMDGFVIRLVGGWMDVEIFGWVSWWMSDWMDEWFDGWVF